MKNGVEEQLRSFPEGLACFVPVSRVHGVGELAPQCEGDVDETVEWSLGNIGRLAQPYGVIRRLENGPVVDR